MMSSRFILISFCALLMAGCKVSRHQKSFINDSTSVSRIDTGSIHKSSTETKSESDWWKELLIYRPRDTMKMQDVNHYITQPAIIYREGGKNKSEVITSNSDSSWRRAIDSLAHRMEQNESSKQTRVLGWGDLLLLGIGIVVAIQLLNWLKNKYSIIKKI